MMSMQMEEFVVMTYHSTSTDDGNVAGTNKVVGAVVVLKDTIRSWKA